MINKIIVKVIGISIAIISSSLYADQEHFSNWLDGSTSTLQNSSETYKAKYWLDPIVDRDYVYTRMQYIKPNGDISSLKKTSSRKIKFTQSGNYEVYAGFFGWFQIGEEPSTIYQIHIRRGTHSMIKVFSCSVSQCR